MNLIFLKRIIIVTLFILFCKDNLSAQSVFVSYPNNNFVNNITSVKESTTPIHYLFKVGNLPYPKLIIQDLYSVFKVNPTYRDSTGGFYFDFLSKNDINQIDFSVYLQNKSYSLDYFKKSSEVILKDMELTK